MNLPWDLLRVLFLSDERFLSKNDALLGLIVRFAGGIGLAPDCSAKMTEVNGNYMDAGLLGVIAQQRDFHDKAEMALGEWTQSEANKRFVKEKGNFVVELEEIVVGNRVVKLKIVIPQKKRTAKRRLVFYFHGGGGVTGSGLRSPIVWELAANLDAVVVSVDYSLAPEHPYPAAVEDNFQAMVWGMKRALEWNADVNRTILTGESAGGMLTAAAAQLWKDRKQSPQIKVIIPLIPMFSPVLSTSYVKWEQTHITPARMMNFFWNMYAPNVYECVLDPLCAPLAANRERLTGIAKHAIVLVAKADVLYSEGIEYVRRLKDARVPTELIEMTGSHVGALVFNNIFSEETKAALRRGDPASVKELEAWEDE